MKAETADYRVELIECVTGTTSTTKLPTRDCAIQVSNIKDRGSRIIRFGREYLPHRASLVDMKIVDDTLAILTNISVILLDLKKGEDVKLFLGLSPSFSPSRDLVLFDEWESRGMPPEMRGRVVSIIDLDTLQRYTIFPGPEKVFEFPVTDPGFEHYLRPSEKDPASRCHSSRYYWSPDHSKFAFSCAFNLRETGYLPGEEGPSGVDVVVVFLSPDIADSTFKRFKVYDKLYRKAVEIDLRKGWSSIDKLRWLSDEVLEIVAKRRDWLHSGATINVVTGEFLVKD